MTGKKAADNAPGHLDARDGTRLSVSEQMILLVEDEFKHLPEIKSENWPYALPIPSLAKRKEDALGALLRAVAAGRKVAEEMTLRFHEQFSEFSSEDFLKLLNEAVSKHFNLNDPEIAVAREIIQQAAKHGYFERLDELRPFVTHSAAGAA